VAPPTVLAPAVLGTDCVVFGEKRGVSTEVDGDSTDVPTGGVGDDRKVKT
jgi:hypothetical protein